MPLYSETSTDTPISVSPSDTEISSITFPVSGLVQDLTVDLDIDAPDEGGGPDPTLVYVDLTAPSLTYVIFHDYGESTPVTGVNIDDDQAPSPGETMDDFNGESTVGGTWDLYVGNGFGTADATINDWTLNITLPAAAPQRVLLPSSPATVVIPSGINFKFKQNRGRRRTDKFSFTVPGVITSSTQFSNGKQVPVNSRLKDITISAINTGTTNETRFNVFKYSNGTTTKIISNRFVFKPGGSYKLIRLANNFVNTFNKGDVVYFTLQSFGTNLQDVCIQATFSERD